LGLSVVGSKPLLGRALGLAEHPTSFGFMSCLGILIALQFVLNVRRFRLLALVALAANMMGLIASGTVSAMMALSLGLAVTLISRRDHFGKLALIGFACAVLLWLVGVLSGIFDYLPSVQRRLLQVTGQTKLTSSWEDRILTYRFAWSKIIDDPVYGVGLNIKYNETVNRGAVENVFLHAWYQGGIFLATAIAVIVIAVLIVALKAMVRKQHYGEASVLVATFAFALTSAFFEQRQFWLPVIIAWGSMSAATIMKQNSQHRIQLGR
jgi:O-antigen ligase